MEISTPLEAEIKEVMNDYWNSYFEGKLDHWANYLVEDYRNIGGTEEEIWNSKIEILDYTKRVIDQMQGTTELRNKQTQIIPYDPYIMVHELLDIFIKVDNEWTFYQKFRLSSLIQKTAADGWKVLHQHGSYPDSKTTEGEAFAFDTLKSENMKLQKAISERTIELEQKNNELAIEAALERVRAIALSMNKPADMLEVCNTIATELDKLDVKEIRNVQTAIFYEERGTYMNYEYYAKHDKKIITETAYTNNEIQRSFASQMLKGNGEFFSTDMDEIELRAWIAYQKTTNVFIDNYLEAASSLSYYWYSLGTVALGISTYLPMKEEDKILFKQFVKVFELAYRRYLDIEKAEAQAREAQIQLAMERVRARTMAMQTSEELKDAAALLFQQVKALGVPAYSCGYNIWEQGESECDSWMSSHDGRGINPALKIPLTEDANFIHFVESKKKGESFYVLEMRGERMQEHYQYLVKTIPVFKAYFEESVKAGFAMPETQIHHLANFSYGNLMFITLEPCPEFHNVFKRFAAVFEQTYTRFLDLKKAEAQAVRAELDLHEIKKARSRAEEALVELQATQKQLIQSEKMASLGELTAGIAHEIQNPLNFVNNFSEVNTELIDELKSELATGNFQLANEIADNIKGNEEKIKHHGKRADAIVKNMLQHSRSTNSAKEPTDINALADEYLRLAYHGLRAKDKSFKATLKTDFDGTVGTINIIPEDIGRVMLNLINNAFYAVGAKAVAKEAVGEQYEPTVTVSTKKISKTVEIRVKDNGNGIAKNVLDKIFQPFFTTKPTGEGTGLGLSLGYDIVTAHDGELKVETKEGVGSEFVILLPTVK